jgi:hypothetical protein
MKTKEVLFLFLREKEKIRVIAKDSRAEALELDSDESLTQEAKSPCSSEHDFSALESTLFLSTD